MLGTLAQAHKIQRSEVEALNTASARFYGQRPLCADPSPPVTLLKPRALPRFRGPTYCKFNIVSGEGGPQMSCRSASFSEPSPPVLFFFSALPTFRASTPERCHGATTPFLFGPVVPNGELLSFHLCCRCLFGIIHLAKPGNRLPQRVRPCFIP